jgi:hypothetical protein
LLVHSQVGEADDGAGGKVYINKYEAQIAETEDEAAYQTSMTAPKIPVVINEAKKNMYGSPRGYKVQLNRPMVNLEPAGYERSKALGEWHTAYQFSTIGWFMRGRDIICVRLDRRCVYLMK